MTLNNLAGGSIITIGQELLLGYEVLPDGSIPLEGFHQARILPDGSIVHTVAAGESFYGIAALYGLTLDEFFQVSGLSESAVLQPAQEVVVGFQPQPTPAADHDDSAGELGAGDAQEMTPGASPTHAVTPRPTLTMTPTPFPAAPPPPTPTAIPSTAVSSPMRAWLPLGFTALGVAAIAWALVMGLRRK
jgi:hypothetical protein